LEVISRKAETNMKMITTKAQLESYPDLHPRISEYPQIEATPHTCRIVSRTNI
jgi:hypothetical protein